MVNMISLMNYHSYIQVLMENKGILVNVFELETGLTTYKDCEYIRITDEKYNLLVMLDYTPIIGEVNGKIDIIKENSPKIILKNDEPFDELYEELST